MSLRQSRLDGRVIGCQRIGDAVTLEFLPRILGSVEEEQLHVVAVHEKIPGVRVKEEVDTLMRRVEVRRLQ